MTSLRIGRQSGRVLVTGGEDKKVNVWAIGKSTPIMGLTGHTSSVESVAFDAGEEFVLAGSSGGTVKMWDLDAKKVIRTLNGHKANCVTLDFHPYGEFFASGSTDTQLKIWDIRRKGCIQTCKHTKGIKLVRFSPDGRWVVAGGEDGTVKIWDLTAGKLLHDFHHRDSAVLALDFHPHEFLLASGGADGVVSFWDLETFELISNAMPTASSEGPVGSITFAPNGQSLLASYQNSLCVWGWEPSPVCLDSIGSEWIDVKDMTIVSDQLIACSGNEDQVGTWMVALSKLNLGAPDGKAHNLDTSKRHDFKVNSVRNVIKSSDSNIGAQINSMNIPHMPDEDAPEPPPPKEPKPKKSSTPTPSVSTPPSSTPSTTPAPTPSVAPKPKTPKPKVTHQPQSGDSFGIDITPFQQKSTPPSPYDSPDTQESQLIAHISDHHTNITAALGSRLSHFKKAKTSWTENGGGTDSKGILAVVGTIGEMEDASVTVEVLRMLPHREDYLTLDICTALLPLMIELFNFTHEDYLLQALAWTSRLVKAFGHVIKTTREAPLAKGVDITKEERLEKCQSCHSNLITIQHLIAPLSRRSGSVGTNAKDLASLLKIYVPEA